MKQQEEHEFEFFDISQVAPELETLLREAEDTNKFLIGIKNDATGEEQRLYHTGMMMRTDAFKGTIFIGYAPFGDAYADGFVDLNGGCRE